MPNGLLRQIEQGLGLPSLREVADTLKSLPDERRLRLLKQILASAAKVKGRPEELQILLELVRLIVANSEQLAAIRDITANLAKLVKYLPKEALNQLPLKEIAEEIKRAAGKNV